MIRIGQHVAIDDREIEEAFIRAGGPGGQKVDKASTAVQLRFDAAHSPNLDERIRTRLRMLAGKRMTADGVLVITARRFRTQERNREDAMSRLIELLRQAATPGRPRVATRPTAVSEKRRRAAKVARRQIKGLRRRVAP